MCAGHNGFKNPLVLSGVLHLCNERDILFCLDAKTKFVRRIKILDIKAFWTSDLE
jgi:hypothetical protein